MTRPRLAISVVPVMAALVFVSCGGSSSGSAGTSVAVSAAPEPTADSVQATSSTAAAEEIAPVEYLNDVIATIEAHALFADRVDLANARIEADEVAAAAATTADSYDFVESLLSDLGDRHSQFLTPERVTALTSASAPPDTRAAEVGVVDSFAVLELPGSNEPPTSGEGPGYSTAAVEALTELRPVCLIIDLTNNDGGNLFTMAQTIAPMLPPGRLLGYVDRLDEEIVYSIDADGNVVTETGEILATSVGPAVSTPARIAVVQDGTTASSGEGVLMALLGRPGVRTFGRPTNGLTTGNELFILADGSALNVTTSVGADFGGKVHDGPIAPDVLVDRNDSFAEAALWLSQEPECGT